MAFAHDLLVQANHLVRLEKLVATNFGSLQEAWERVRDTDEANVFCAALLLGTRWAK